MENRIISDMELHAFIDGELDPEQARIVSEAISASAELSARVALYRSDKDRIMRSYGPLIEQPLPAEILAAFARASAKPAQRTRSRRLPAAAAIAALLIAGSIGYAQFSTPGNDALVAQAVAARDGDVKADFELGMSELQSIDSSDRVVRDAVSSSIKAPNLERAGYKLVGVGVYGNTPGKRSVQIRYREANGKIFTLYLRSGGGPDRFDLSHRAQTQICIWQNDTLSAVMLGEMSAKEMLKVATLTYSDLNF